MIQLRLLDTGRYSSMSAFSVGLTQHQEVHTGQSVLYNNILTDTNTAYSASTGVYTVPSSGLYIFHFFRLDLFGLCSASRMAPVINNV
jgi:hypothetical protein